MLTHKYKQIINNQTGFTLVEVIVGMALMLIIMIPLSSSLTTGMKSYQYNMAQNRNITSTRELLNVIEDELRYATEISVVPGIDSILPGPQITYTVGNQPRTISTVPGTPPTTNTLVISYNGTVQKNIATNNLQSIQFTRDTTNSKRLTILAQLNNRSYPNIPNMSSSTTLIMSNM